MYPIFSTLTVFFEPPFWVGVFTREDNGKHQSCKVTFGSEPKDPEIYLFLQENWHRLSFSPQLKVKKQTTAAINPKRMQRIVKKQLAQQTGVSTKSQQAIKLQIEQRAKTQKAHRKELEQAKKEKVFALKQEKRKEKHRGH